MASSKKSPTEYLRDPYARIVIPVDEGGFHAEILEFAGCYAQGETLDEAYANLEDSAYSWIEACQEQGQSIPAAFGSAGYSGRIVLRLPKSVHRQAARMAERDGVSLNQFLMSAVASRVGAEDVCSGLAKLLVSRVDKIEAAAMAVGAFFEKRVSTAHPSPQDLNLDSYEPTQTATSTAIN